MVGTDIGPQGQETVAQQCSLTAFRFAHLLALMVVNLLVDLTGSGDAQLSG